MNKAQKPCIPEISYVSYHRKMVTTLILQRKSILLVGDQEIGDCWYGTAQLAVRLPRVFTSTEKIVIN